MIIIIKCCVYKHCKSQLVRLGGVSHPGDNAPTQDSLYSASVKVHEHSKQPPEMLKMLMGLLH